MRLATHTAAPTTGFFKSLSGKLRASCAVAALALLGATSVQAVPVTYTFRTDIVGTMEGAAVSGSLTINALGDTNDIVTYEPNSYAEFMPTSVTFDLSGYGSFTASPGFAFAVVTQDGYLSLSMAPDNLYGSVYGFALSNVSGEGYELQSQASVGPLTYDDSNNYAGPIATSAGSFQINTATGISFQAAVANANAVPEPGSLSLFAGAALLLAVKRRRLAQQAG